MSKVEDTLIGVRVGNLKVLRQTESLKDRSKVYECLCDCGNICKKTRSRLNHHLKPENSHKKIACGCLIGKGFKHGDSKHSLYSRYKTMLARCFNIKNRMYPRYGGRGITVCERWLNDDGFHNFIFDMGEPPQDGNRYSIDRINNDGDYTPENCRWATYLVQANNKSNVNFIEYENEIYAMSDFCRKFNISKDRFSIRLTLYGNNIEDALKICQNETKAGTYTGHKWIIFKKEARRLKKFVVTIPNMKSKAFLTLEEAVEYKASVLNTVGE